MVLVADVKEGAWETEFVQAENWQHSKLLNTHVDFCHVVCTQKKQIGENSLNIPRRQRTWKYPNRHDGRRPVLEAGLKIELLKSPNAVAILSVKYWLSEALTSNFLTFGCSPIFHPQKMLLYTFQSLVRNATVHQSLVSPPWGLSLLRVSGRLSITDGTDGWILASNRN